jgi:RNA 2',3'-cyclic 3'-phosphodiesterase
MEQKRVFVGVDLPKEAKNQVADYIDALRFRYSSVRASWPRPENLHITLRFVGNVGPDELDELTRRTDQVAAVHAPIDAVLAGTGNFAQRRIRSDALWIGIKADGLLGIAAGLAVERSRPFVPHLTIARLKDPASGRELVQAHLDANFGPITFRIEELVIYESTLQPSGSVYSVLSKHQLKG